MSKLFDKEFTVTPAENGGFIVSRPGETRNFATVPKAWAFSNAADMLRFFEHEIYRDPIGAAPDDESDGLAAARAA